ncbi:hypothetical protein EYF80_062180 [Liparis tanakae]|uniref:Uncharacterized protein n=1 Tax=Liparis tanakae TaxID=230148 RepID=A0A4Z2EGS2_9TELE|nr:hypothetical protein EYF80_062180 [Liparis tanakae]
MREIGLSGSSVGHRSCAGARGQAEAGQQELSAGLPAAEQPLLPPVLQRQAAGSTSGPPRAICRLLAPGVAPAWRRQSAAGEDAVFKAGRLNAASPRERGDKRDSRPHACSTCWGRSVRRGGVAFRVCWLLICGGGKRTVNNAPR